jgi:hypothetical protein
LASLKQIPNLFLCFHPEYYCRIAACIVASQHSPNHETLDPPLQSDVVKPPITTIVDEVHQPMSSGFQVSASSAVFQSNAAAEIAASVSAAPFATIIGKDNDEAEKGLNIQNRCLLLRLFGQRLTTEFAAIYLRIYLQHLDHPTS